MKTKSCCFNARFSFPSLRALMGGSRCYQPVRCFSARPASFRPFRLLSPRVRIFSGSPLFSDSENLSFRPKPTRFFSHYDRPVPPSTASVEPDVASKIAYLKSKVEEIGIDCRLCKPGKHLRALCPKCKGGSSKEKSLSLLVRQDGELAVWQCFRAKCGWKGCVQAYREVTAGYVKTNEAWKIKEYRVITESELQLEPLCKELVEYFRERSISAKTLERNKVMQRKIDDQIVIAFTYRRNGGLVSCNYLKASEESWQEMDTERVFYGLDDINQASEIIIVEGEINKLSMEEAGYPNCVSIPYSAHEQASKELSVENMDFQYLWSYNEYLEKASRIILATDANSSGQDLAEELACRLGKERCWRVKWPMKNGTEGCKDANEVLMHFGPSALRTVVKNVELYPIRGLYQFNDFCSEIDAYYHQSQGFEIGVSTGWKALDELYKVVPGELTVITGIPNSGKSEWIDALLCNVNENHGWRFALCSMENKVHEHARKLLEKHMKKPFFSASYAGYVQRISVEELEEGKEWLDSTFYLIRCEDDCFPSFTWILERAKFAVLRFGIRGLVIDPYNEIDHQRPSGQTETEYVSKMLTKIKRFAQHHSCHVWFVAHPRQLQNWDGGAPNLYDISGSAHFINKCDNGIVIHRNRDANAAPLDCVQVCVRKVRNKVVGSIGEAFLSYNRITGEYMELPVEMSTMKRKRR